MPVSLSAGVKTCPLISNYQAASVNIRQIPCKLATSQPEENIHITLILRRKCEAPVEPSLDNHLSHEELADLHGTRPEDENAVRAFAAEHQLSIAKVESGARSITVSGPLAKLADLFGADVRLSKIEEKTYRTRQGHLTVPSELAGCVTAVLGFDQRPVALTYHRRAKLSLSSTDYSPPILQSSTIFLRIPAKARRSP